MPLLMSYKKAWGGIDKVTPKKSELRHRPLARVNGCSCKEKYCTQ